jgi:hypothetical protein
MREKSARLMAALGAGIGVAALALQLSLMLGRFYDRGDTTLAGLWRFLGFFTNVSNLFAALVLAHAALRPKARTGLGAPRIEAAATAAIIMAGILNSALLAGRFNPQGLYKLADLALHDMVPFAVALFWLLRPHGELRLEDALFSVSWPLVYCVYALMRGAADGWYPYYFLDPAILGLTGLATNIAALGAAFLAAALSLVGIDRLLGPGLSGRRPFAGSLLRNRTAAAFAGLAESDGQGGG